MILCFKSILLRCTHNCCQYGMWFLQVCICKPYHLCSQKMNSHFSFRAGEQSPKCGLGEVDLKIWSQCSSDKDPWTHLILFFIYSAAFVRERFGTIYSFHLFSHFEDCSGGVKFANCEFIFQKSWNISCFSLTWVTFLLENTNISKVFNLRFTN